MRMLADLNALAMFFVGDHPGHEYVRETLEPVFEGRDTLVLFGYQPIRLHWVLEDMGVSRRQAGNKVCSLVQRPIEWLQVDATLTLDSYAVSSEKEHDLYDCFYVALARQADVDAIVTTDRDFESLCRDESFEYCNPVPEDVLEQFGAFS
jgi:predicted nucleic acid-binding protein